MCKFKTWLGEGENVLIRFYWGLFYFIAGAILIILLFTGCKNEWGWTAGWSSVGIGAWLINSRERNKKNNTPERYNHCLHFVLYFGFALVVSTLAAFALGRCKSGNLNFPLSALIGLTMGFASERLNDLNPMGHG